MRGIKLLVSTVGAVCVVGAFGIGSASALPLFVSGSGTYPVHVLIHSGLGRWILPNGQIVHCDLDLGLDLIGLRLALYLRVLHKCTATLFLSTAECNSPGEPKGLIFTHTHAWWGYLTNAAGEKMVGLLTQPLTGSTDAEFECAANALEHVKITILGEAVGAVPASQLNTKLSKFTTVFTQSSNGVQTPQTFLLPSPLALMTGVHPTADISGTINEKSEVAEEGTEELTLLGTETGEIQG